MDFLWKIDSNILLFLQDTVRTPLLTPVMKLITALGNAGVLWVLITVFLLAFKKTRRVGMMSALALLISLLVNNILLKNLVARIRPYETVDGLTRLVEKQVDYSFPSGHAGSSFASACVLYRGLPKQAGIPAVVLAALISFSRLYVGVHYPSDVLAGILIGTAAGFFAEWIWKMLEPRIRMKHRTNHF